MTLRLLSQQEQFAYLLALDNFEAKNQTCSDTQKIREEIRGGKISDSSVRFFESHFNFQSYLNVVHSSSDPTRGSGVLTEDPKDLFNERAVIDHAVPLTEITRILKEGIRTEQDVQISLHWIEDIAPSFASSIEAFRRSNIKIIPDPQMMASDGTATFLTVSYFDRNAEYPREIRLKNGTEIFTLVHELAIHALKQTEHPTPFREIPYPLVSKNSSFGEMRSQAMKILIHEEALAFSAECFFKDEAEANGSKIDFREPMNQKIYKTYKDAGGVRGKGVEAVAKFLESTAYQDQAKVSSVVVALAGKLGKETDPKYSPKHILDLVGDASGEGIRDGAGKINPQKAFKAAYDLLKEGFPHLNTFEVLKSIAAQGDPFEALSQLMEAKFDGASAVKTGKDLAQMLENAPDLGRRPKVVDQSKDRGHLKNHEMAKLVVSSWADYISLLERFKGEKKIGGADYLKNLLHLAEYAPDPIAGKLFGQAKILAYAQTDQSPWMLLDFALSLKRSGYEAEAAQALLDYPDFAIKPYENLRGEHEYANAGETYLKTLEQFPVAIQQKGIEKLLNSFSPFKLPRSGRKDSSELEMLFQCEFGKKIEFTPEEKKIIEEIMEQGYPHPDLNRATILFDQIVHRLGVDIQSVDQFWKKKEAKEFSLKNRTVFEGFRDYLIEYYQRTFSNQLENNTRILQMVQRWPKPIPGDLKDRIARWESILRKTPELKTSKEEIDWAREHTAESLSKALNERYQYGVMHTGEDGRLDHIYESMLIHRKAIVLPNSMDILPFFTHEDYFEEGMSRFAKFPDLPEKLGSLRGWLSEVIQSPTVSVSHKLLYLRFVEETARKVMEREIKTPGITRSEALPALKPTDIIPKLSSADISPLTVPEESWAYNDTLSHLAQITLQSDSEALQEYGRKLLHRIYRQGSHRLSGVYEDQTVNVELKLSGFSNNKRKFPEQNNIEQHRFEILINRLVALENFKPEDEPLLREALNGYQTCFFQSESTENLNRHARYLFNFTLKLIHFGNRSLIEKALSLGDSYKSLLPNLPKGALLRSLQLFEHGERYWYWKILLNDGNEGRSQVQKEATAFLKSLETDLQGKTRYSANELALFADLLNSFKGFEESQFGFFQQATERYAKQWEVNKVIETEEEGGERHAIDLSVQDELKQFVKIIEKSKLPSPTKDKLLSHLVDRVTSVVFHADLVSMENLAVLKALKELYRLFPSNQYPNTEKEMYVRINQLVKAFQYRLHDFKTEDVLTVTSYFNEFLSMHPWVQNPIHKPLLEQQAKSGQTTDWEFLKDIDRVYPSEKQQFVSPLRADGSLNVEAAETGLIDPSEFEKNLFERMDNGKLKGKELSQAVAALFRGLILRSDQKWEGDSAALMKIPAFAGVWNRIRQNWGSFSPLTKALFNGVTEGLGGAGISSRSLFFAEILQDPHLSLSEKRQAWSVLRDAKIITRANDQFLKRYVVERVNFGTTQHVFTENHYYEVMGKMLALNQGKFPSDELVFLLLNQPEQKEEAEYFKAFEKWIGVRIQGKGKVDVDLSNFYDTFFFLLHEGTRYSGQPSFPSVFEKSKQIGAGTSLGTIDSMLTTLYPIESAYNGNDPFGHYSGKEGPFHYSFQTSDPQFRWTVGEGRATFKSILKQFEALREVEGEALPQFIEEFPEELRQFLGAVLSKVPGGVKEGLFQRVLESQKEGDSGKMLYELLNTLGWAKIAQLLSVSPLVPAETRKELASLRDQVPHSTETEIRRLLERELGEFYDQIESLELPPVKSGSIGEVVKAKLQDGSFVAIKLVTDQRYHSVKEMLNILKEAVELMEWAGMPTVMGINLRDSYTEFKKMINVEIDLSQEAKHLEDYGSIKPPKGIRLPKIIYGGAFVSKRVLVLEWIDGKEFSFENVKNSKNGQQVRQSLVELLAKPLWDFMFQGDPHPGNFLITPEGELALLDFGQLELVSPQEVSKALELLLLIYTGKKTEVDRVIDLLEETSHVSITDESKVQLKNSLIRFLETPRDFHVQQATLIFDFLSIVYKHGLKVKPSFNKLLKYYHTLEGTLLEMDPHFDLSRAMRKDVLEFVKENYSQKFYNDFINTYRKAFILETAGRVGAGALPFGIGEIGSTLLMSLFAPGYKVPRVEELLGNFAIMSAGGESGKLLIDGIINKSEGKAFFERVFPPKPGAGISGKGFLRRFVPLAAAIVLDDIIKGRPIDLKNTAIGMAHIGVASGAVHMMGVGVRYFKWSQRLATGLGLLQVGSAAGAPESGGATLLGAAFASVVEFTLLKGMNYTEKKYVYYQEREKCKMAYSRAMVEMNNLVKEVQERGLESVPVERIIQARGNLEQAKAGYSAYFQWRVKNLEEEREMTRKELEEDRREYLIDRGSRSVFEINKMYDEKIAKLDQEYNDEIVEIQGAEQTIEFRSLALNNPDILKMSPTAPQEEIPTIQARVIKKEIAENQNAFIAQYQTYEDQLTRSLKKAQENYYRKELQTVFPNVPDSEINQTVAQLTQISINKPAEPIDWEQINQHLQKINQAQIEKEL